MNINCSRALKRRLLVQKFSTAVWAPTCRLSTRWSSSLSLSSRSSSARSSPYSAPKRLSSTSRQFSPLPLASLPPGFSTSTEYIYIYHLSRCHVGKYYLQNECTRFPYSTGKGGQELILLFVIILIAVILVDVLYVCMSLAETLTE